MKKTIYMELRANDYFALPVTEEIQAGGDTVSTLRYRIIFSDMSVSYTHLTLPTKLEV